MPDSRKKANKITLKRVSLTLLFLLAPLQMLFVTGPVFAANSPPTVGTITPSSGTSYSNQAVTFTTTYADPNGWQDIKYVHLLINTAVNGKNCFYGYYNQNANKLFLRNDANTAWLGGFIPGSSNVIENSYAKLDCSKTTVSGSGNTLTVKWPVTFKSTFTGSKNTYLYVVDDASANSGWVKKGDLYIFRQPIAPPP